MMRFSRHKGIQKIFADRYALTFVADRPFVYLDDGKGMRLAELFLYSSVNSLHGQDDTVEIKSWEAVENADEIVFSIEASSSLWTKKVYRFRCSPDRFSYEIEVDGRGVLCDVDYFGGYYSGQTRWGSGFFWSGQNFLRGFNPEPSADEVNYFAPAEGSAIDLMGVPLPGKANWFFTPPPFVFGFQGMRGWVGMGVEAQPGENRFTEYAYQGRKTGFCLSLSYEGHTQISGKTCLPAIGFYFGTDEYQVITEHVKALQDKKFIASPPQQAKPAWWNEPIYCGWGSQCYLASQVKGRAPDFARQEEYEKFLSTLEANQISPGIIVLDDKWQSAYGENYVDELKWPDLPGFIRTQHQQGRKVLLWLKAWDPEGIPVDECITNARGLPLAVDPSNPAFESRLRASIRRMLSPEGYGADGFKIDFTARIPSGPAICTYGDLWGLELMKRYLEIIYEEAKLAKSDALVMTHTPHPYLAGVVDMIRLNDINMDKDINRAMILRSRIAAIAMPGAIIDTDNWPITNKAAWREYLSLQPELGVPSLYYASHIDSTKEPLEAKDYALIREVWARHRAKSISVQTPGKRTWRPLLSLWRRHAH
jgi:hypothetical protein